MGDIRAVALIAAIDQERKRGSRIRLAYSGGAVVIAATALFWLYGKADDFDMQRFAAAMSGQAQSVVWPAVRAEAQSLGDEALPALGASLSRQAATILPEVQEVVAVETSAFQQGARDRLVAALERSFAAQMEEHHEALAAAYPAMKDDSAAWETLAEEAQDVTRAWAVAELDETFSEHLEVFASMDAKLAMIHASAQADGSLKGHREPEDMVLMFLEMMNDRLGQGRS